LIESQILIALSETSVHNIYCAEGWVNWSRWSMRHYNDCAFIIMANIKKYSWSLDVGNENRRLDVKFCIKLNKKNWVLKEERLVMFFRFTLTMP